MIEIQKTVKDMMEDKREKIVIDLRKPEEFAKDSIDGAKNIYWEEFDTESLSMEMKKPIYLMCYTGETSDEIAKELCQRGLEAYSIAEGYRGYLRWKLSSL